jgi:hypothetical protein
MIPEQKLNLAISNRSPKFPTPTQRRAVFGRRAGSVRVSGPRLPSADAGGGWVGVALWAGRPSLAGGLVERGGWRISAGCQGGRRISTCGRAEQVASGVRPGRAGGRTRALGQCVRAGRAGRSELSVRVGLWASVGRGGRARPPLCCLWAEPAPPLPS